MTEGDRKRLIAMREFIGSQIEVGLQIGRSRNTIIRFETKGADVPLWYQIVIPELYRRKKEGRPLSPV